MSETSAPDEHVVFFTTALGDPAAERYPSQQSAISRVESLCNEDHVEDAKVYALVPVPLQVHSFVRVEVDSSAYRPVPSVPAAPAMPPPSAAGESDSDPASTPDDEPTGETDEAADVASDPAADGDAVDDAPEAGDGAPSHGRNLGFFVH